jgi:hypothetical protein
MLPFTMGRLPYVDSVTVRVCVSLIKLLLQTVMGWVPALEYMLLGACGHALSLPGDECSHPRGRDVGHVYPESESPQAGWLDARGIPGPRQERNRWVGFRISILVRWPILFGLEWWSLYTLLALWLPSRLPLEGVDHIHTHGS